MSKTYSITNKSTGEKHDINHDAHSKSNNCIHCHFTLYTDRYRYTTFEDYKNTYNSNILSKLHTGCKYYDCKVCESLGKNEK
jgi:hypothetical protein